MTLELTADRFLWVNRRWCEPDCAKHCHAPVVKKNRHPHDVIPGCRLAPEPGASDGRCWQHTHDESAFTDARRLQDCRERMRLTEDEEAVAKAKPVLFHHLLSMRAVDLLSLGLTARQLEALPSGE